MCPTHNNKSGQRSEERLRCGVVAERLADVRKAVHISRAEDKASAELEWIFAEFVLVMTRSAGPFAADGIVFAKKMEQICRAEFRGSIRLALVVDQKRELDSCLLAKHSSVVGITEADGRKRSSFIPEGLFVFAQLRDMLAAKNSSVMAKKDERRGAAGPERPEPDFPSIGVGKHNFREPAAEGLIHDGSILGRALRVVNSCASAKDSVHLPSERSRRTQRNSLGR
jgi:hypothetical protein